MKYFRIKNIKILSFISVCLFFNNNLLGQEKKDVFLNNISNELQNIILNNDLESKKNDLYHYYSILTNNGSQKAIDIVLNTFMECGSETKENSFLSSFIGRTVNEYPELKKNFYQKMQKYINSKDMYLRNAAWNILAKVDNRKFYKDLISFIEKIDNQKENLSLTDSIDTLNALWKLESLKNLQTLNFIKTYSPKNLREKIAIAVISCQLNFNYVKNFNFIKEIMQKNIQDEGSSEFYIVEDFLYAMEELDDPRILDFLENNKYKGLYLDCEAYNVDSVITQLKKSRKKIHWSHIKTLKSSSTLDSDLGENCDYYPYYCIDRDNMTAWVEGDSSDGIGEWIEFDLDTEYEINRIDIINGYDKSDLVFKLNNRVKKMDIQFSDTIKSNVMLDDNNGWQSFDFKPIRTNSLRFIIKDIYKGLKYKDTCISEILIWGTAVE